MKNAICIYTKAPIPGRTKSRLSLTIGDIPAAKLARAMLLDLCDEVSQINDLAFYVCYPPENLLNEFIGIIGDNVSLMAQVGNDLGERMTQTFTQLLQLHQNVIIIGSDCITHSTEHLIQALDILNHKQIVIQPARDGGYVLIGQSTLITSVFKDIQWGEATVYDDTLAGIHQFNHDVQILDETFDIDVEDDLEFLRLFLAQNSRKNTQDWFSQYSSG
ncbi:TIGR04282 family arsenosugar biosynthesis glycosyltransferase [bacterium AH-315-E10]|nr:TIGR04282 family arsenosugar biosynthesis glycosyltransferase [bacterium AH-315-E10]